MHKNKVKGKARPKTGREGPGREKNRGARCW